MEIIIEKYRKTLIICTFVLVIIGVFMVYQASTIWANYKFNDQFYYLKRQSIFAVLGIVMFFVGKKINLNLIKKYAEKILLISLLLMILVLIPKVGLVRGGSQSWLGFGAFSFQPSELFKLALIIYGAKEYEKNYYETNKIKTHLKFALVFIIGTTLIMLQPDFGTAVVLGLSIFCMFFITKLKIRYFVIVILIALVAGSALIIFSDYRMARITAFIDPFKDPLGSGFQIIQSLFAIGPGGLIGRGISYQKYYYLPEPQTDFIFAILVEQYGLIGGLILILLYAGILISSYKIIKHSSNLFDTFLKTGLFTLFFAQVVINLGVVTSLLPVTGITLPLISYGGSSLTILLFSLGVITNESK